MNKRTVIIIFLSFIFFKVDAQQEPKKYIYEDSTYTEKKEVVEVVPEEEYTTDAYDDETIDTTLVYQSLKNNKDTVNALKNSKAFAYVKNLDSLLKEVQKKQDKEKKNEPANTEVNTNPSWFADFFASSLVQFIFYGLAIAVVLFILYKLFFAEGIFKKNTTKNESVAEVEMEEEVNEDSDFNKLIKNAEANKNYRLAVRYQYLKTLHGLAQKQLVHMAADKTNFAYVQEIANEEMRTKFAALTLNYEYVWYGEFNINELGYTKIAIGFNNFNTAAL